MMDINVKIADFGLSRVNNTDMMTGVLGTFVKLIFIIYSIGWLQKYSSVSLILLKQIYIPLEYFYFNFLLRLFYGKFAQERHHIRIYKTLMQS